MLGSSPAVGIPPLTPRALAVTRHLLVHGPASRGHIGDALQLSDASMSRLARTLTRAGIVSERQEVAATVGRPRQILSAVPGARHVVGVKLTADTAYGVLCDLFGSVVAAGRLALPAPVDDAVPVDRTARVVARLVRQLGKSVARVDGLGVSLGGVVSDRAVVREGTFLGWRDVDLATVLSDVTGLPVVVSNDVIALAREQLWFGAGRTHSTFGLITVGAGVGFGLVREGQVIEELIDNGHLLAHAPIDRSGPPCSLGHRGCVSAYLDHNDIAARRTRMTGRAVTYAELSGDPAAARSPWFAEAAAALGHLVATVAGALQTDRIVLAGEDARALFAAPEAAATIEDRLRPGPHETQKVTLDVSTEPLSFTDWARGAGVAGIQHILGVI